MTTAAVRPDTTMPAHREAMRLAATEYQRFVDLLHRLAPDDWAKPTDCPNWDVRDMVAHNLGSTEANASIREFAHQFRTSTKRAKTSGELLVDELTALQVEDRASLSPDQLRRQFEHSAPRAVAGRRRMPGVLRRRVKVDTPPPFERMTLGYLCDTIFTRDVWMHRVDICRATANPIELTAAHDGRLVAAVVGEWAERHGQPYNLELEGPAGGQFRRGDDGERMTLDAVEFCRILSGRAAPSAPGLLETEVLF
jgi:uncharacterized protein (TIGR03083 family)